MVKRWSSRAAVWAGLRRDAGDDRDLQLERYIAGSLTDEALAWAVSTWRQRYL